MNTPIKIKIILGSTRQNRFSEKPAQWIFEEAKKLEGAEAELLDLRDYPMPFFDSPISPSMAKGQYPNEVVKKWAEKINDGDAFIIVAPEYNHGYTAVLKNALDVIYTEWNRKPVGFVSYGSAVGARSVEQLRQVAVELQMAPIRNAIHIPVDIFFAAMMGKGPTGSEMFEPIRKGSMGDPVERFFNDLLWWARALKAAREI
ncbi:MAG: NAD(P)H-dependent oxidoreductase [bacterium]|nr:NAD(P)H-dependent oxidoreductase [bacterium]